MFSKFQCLLAFLLVCMAMSICVAEDRAAIECELGKVSLKDKKYETAIKQFTEAIRIDPNYHEAYYQRGVAYLKIGKIELSITDLNKAKELRVIEAKEKELDHLINLESDTEHIEIKENSPHQVEIELGEFPDSKLERSKVYGATAESEEAVAMSLEWLAAQQNKDGSWSFDQGTEKSPTGATGLALLAFLGAGHTHKEKGKYKENIYKCLYFLVRSMKFSPEKGGDLRGADGSMYSHGIAAYALCEAYTLSGDKSLMNPAQQAINYSVYSQDKSGGWIYAPKQPAHTSLLGWQLMTFKTGFIGSLNVPKKAIAGVITFLDQVQTEHGAFYGDTASEKQPTSTAIGLLCRMQLGWKKDENGLQNGVKYLNELGPSKTDTYFNYYATQVLFHYGGEEWKKWNKVLQDQLVNAQITEGTFKEEKGSWKPSSVDEKKGGRLFATAINTMTLETYYIYLPRNKNNNATLDSLEN